jgi:hypothetical protein
LAINYATKKWLEAPVMEKIGIYIKALGEMCCDGVKSLFKK